MADKKASCSAKIKVMVDVSWPHSLDMNAPVKQLHDMAERECLAILEDATVRGRGAIRIIGKPEVHMITYNPVDLKGT
jgi:hypothetical protein